MGARRDRSVWNRNPSHDEVSTMTRFRLAPVATASTWLTLWSSLHQAAKRARGTDMLSNREAVAIAVAFRELAPFALWHQFAAVAYGWDAEQNCFDTSNAQSERMYPPEMAAELWLATKAIATELEPTSKPPRIELDADDFSDLLVQGRVRDALLDDGSKVLAASAIKPKPKPRVVIEVGATDKPNGNGRLLLFGLAIGGLWLAFGRKKPKPRRARMARRTKARARYAAT
jgi:hypothetical protein